MPPAAHPPISDAAAIAIIVLLCLGIAAIPLTILRLTARANAREGERMAEWARSLGLSPSSVSLVPAASAAHWGHGRSFSWRGGVVSVLPIRGRAPAVTLWARPPTAVTHAPVFAWQAGLESAYLSVVGGYQRQPTGDPEFDAAFATFCESPETATAFFPAAGRAAMLRTSDLTTVSYDAGTFSVSLRGETGPQDWTQALDLLAVLARLS